MKVVIRERFPSGEPNWMVRFVADERTEKVASVVIVALAFAVFIFVVFPLMADSHGWDKILDWIERVLR